MFVKKVLYILDYIKLQLVWFSHIRKTFLWNEPWRVACMACNCAQVFNAARQKQRMSASSPALGAKKVSECGLGGKGDLFWTPQINKLLFPRCEGLNKCPNLLIMNDTKSLFHSSVLIDEPNLTTKCINMFL